MINVQVSCRPLAGEAPLCQSADRRDRLHRILLIGCRQVCAGSALRDGVVVIPFLRCLKNTRITVCLEGASCSLISNLCMGQPYPLSAMFMGRGQRRSQLRTHLYDELHQWRVGRGRGGCRESALNSSADYRYCRFRLPTSMKLSTGFTHVRTSAAYSYAFFHHV
jgi:hypothetical protein